MFHNAPTAPAPCVRELSLPCLSLGVLISIFSAPLLTEVRLFYPLLPATGNRLSTSGEVCPPGPSCPRTLCSSLSRPLTSGVAVLMKGGCTPGQRAPAPCSLLEAWRNPLLEGIRLDAASATASATAVSRARSKYAGQKPKSRIACVACITVLGRCAFLASRSGWQCGPARS